MTDSSHASGTGPRTASVEIGVAIAMLLFGAIVIFGSLQSASAGAPRARVPASSRSMSGW